MGVLKIAIENGEDKQQDILPHGNHLTSHEIGHEAIGAADEQCLYVEEEHGINRVDAQVGERRQHRRGMMHLMEFPQEGDFVRKVMVEPIGQLIGHEGGEEDDAPHRPIRQRRSLARAEHLAHPLQHEHAGEMVADDGRRHDERQYEDIEENVDIIQLRAVGFPHFRGEKQTQRLADGLATADEPMADEQERHRSRQRDAKRPDEVELPLHEGEEKFPYSRKPRSERFHPHLPIPVDIPALADSGL